MSTFIKIIKLCKIDKSVFQKVVPLLELEQTSLTDDLIHSMIEYSKDNEVDISFLAALGGLENSQLHLKESI